MKTIYKAAANACINGFFIILLYTLCTLPILARAGGPCNGGVIYVVLGPILLFIALIQYIVFRSCLKFNQPVSIFKKLLHLHEELFFFTTAYLHLHAIAHYNSSTFTPHIFLDMHEINKKRFMYTKKNSISQ